MASSDDRQPPKAGTPLPPTIRDQRQRRKEQGREVRKPKATEVLPPRLTKAEARKRTDKAKADAAALWLELFELHEVAAHEALGYESFGDHMEAEFGFSRVHGYRQVKAATMMRELEQSNPGVTRGAGERHMRALLPLSNNPELLRQTWERLLEEHLPKLPTVVQTHEAVQAQLNRTTKPKPPKPPKPEPEPPINLDQRVRELRDAGDVPETIARKLYEQIPAVAWTATNVRKLLLPDSVLDEGDDFHDGFRSMNSAARAAAPSPSQEQAERETL